MKYLFFNVHTQNQYNTICYSIEVFISLITKVGSSSMLKETAKAFLPCFICGKVVKGFGRGGKQLGCPTANYGDSIVSQLPPTFPCGVYYGWANVENGAVHKMVMSVGWNPQFHNTKKTIEAHILHSYPQDFYGSMLKVVVLGYIRQMSTFNNLEELKEAIKKDVDNAVRLLEFIENDVYKSHSFFGPGGEAAILHSSDSLLCPDYQSQISKDKNSTLNGGVVNNRHNS